MKTSASPQRRKDAERSALSFVLAACVYLPILWGVFWAAPALTYTPAGQMAAVSLSFAQFSGGSAAAEEAPEPTPATAPEPAEAFFQRLVDWGVRTVICTDVSRDGMLGGTNVELYRDLSRRFPLDFIASGGVTSISDVRALKKLGLYGAILGKALYTGRLDLKTVIAAMRDGK